MIVALDVQYDENQSRATAGAVVFSRWTDPAPAAEYTSLVEGIQPYIPGEFFRRELPCLLAVIQKIQEPITATIIDGYVRLDEKPGLGQYLFEHMKGKIPVVGVAKTKFHGAVPVEVLRGSGSPLFVTAVGLTLPEAANCIRDMHGPYRIPTLLRRVDQLARGL